MGGPIVCYSDHCKKITKISIIHVILFPNEQAKEGGVPQLEFRDCKKFNNFIVNNHGRQLCISLVVLVALGTFRLKLQKSQSQLQIWRS